MSGELSKFKKYLELTEGAVLLPSVITVTGYEINKEIYLLEELFMPLIAVYANFLSKDLIGKEVFDFEYEKNENYLLYFKVIDKKEDEEDKDDGSESIKILYIMESLYQVFPKNAMELSKKNFYDDMISKWRRELDKYKEGQKIDVLKIMSSMINESLYINLVYAAKQNIKQNV